MCEREVIFLCNRTIWQGILLYWVYHLPPYETSGNWQTPVTIKSAYLSIMFNNTLACTTAFSIHQYPRKSGRLSQETILLTKMWSLVTGGLKYGIQISKHHLNFDGRSLVQADNMKLDETLKKGLECVCEHVNIHNICCVLKRLRWYDTSHVLLKGMLGITQ